MQDGLRQPSPFGEKYCLKLVTPRDLPTLIVHSVKEVSKRSTARVVVHFHGGPEAVERGESRYGNLIPKLLSCGHLYFGWNYPGSIGFGRSYQRYPWKNWRLRILKEWVCVQEFIFKETNIPKRDWTFVGGSFGASVALVIAQNEPEIKKLILCSPTLSISSQISRAKKYRDQYLWFKKRFSPKDLRDFEFVHELHKLEHDLAIVWSGRDEVLDAKMIRHSIISALAEGKFISCLEQGRSFHYPRSFAARKAREQFIFQQVLS